MYTKHQEQIVLLKLWLLFTLFHLFIEFIDEKFTKYKNLLNI